MQEADWIEWLSEQALKKAVWDVAGVVRSGEARVTW